MGFKSTCIYYERNVRLVGEKIFPLYRGCYYYGITRLRLKSIRLNIGLGVLNEYIGMICFKTKVSFWYIIGEGTNKNENNT